MTTFLLDIWQDLRSKRLWPVAVVLLVAAVAVPVALIKPAPQAEPEAGVPATADAAADTGLISSTSQPEAGSSGLGSFRSKNPFRSGIKPESAQAEESASEETQIDRGGPTTDATDTGLAPDASASGTDLGSAGPPGDVSGTTGGAPSGSSGTPAAGSTSGGSGGGGKVETSYFSYEVDIVYGEKGEARDFDGLEPFEALTDRNPRLLFIGADAKGEVATFSVLDEDLRDRGDGRCVEIGGRCSVLFLKPGEEHRFIDRDSHDEYKLELVAIHEVEIDK